MTKVRVEANSIYPDQTAPRSTVRLNTSKTFQQTKKAVLVEKLEKKSYILITDSLANKYRYVFRKVMTYSRVHTNIEICPKE